MPKRSATTLTLSPNAIAHSLWNGSIVVCDPDAPIEHDCRVLLVIDPRDPKLGAVALEGRCLTKHPAKAKTGIGVAFTDGFGKPNQLWGCWVSGTKRCVYRIVAEFPPAIPAPLVVPRRREADRAVLADHDARGLLRHSHGL